MRPVPRAPGRRARIVRYDGCVVPKSMPAVFALACLLVACGEPPQGPVPEPSPGTGEPPLATGDTTDAPPTTSTGADATGNEGEEAGEAGGSEAGSTDDGPATFGGSFPEVCPPGVEPSLQMGLGDVDFRPIDSGVAQLVQGHQGGYHVVIGLRGTGLDLADWGSGHLRATVGGEVLADYDTIVVMECDDGGEFAEALWINLIFDAQPPMLLGQMASVEVEFTDASEVVVSASGQLEISEDIVHL